MITPLDSLKFMLVINELVEQSKEGYKPFSELKTYEEKMDFKGVVYDDETRTVNTEENMAYYDVVLDSLIDENHHDVISTYDNIHRDLSIQFAEDLEDKESSHIFVHIGTPRDISEGDDLFVCILDGHYRLM